MVCHFLVGQFDLKFYWNIHIGWLRFLLVYSFFSSVSFFLNLGIFASKDLYSVIFHLKPDTFTISIIPLLLNIFLSWPHFNLVDSIQIKKKKCHEKYVNIHYSKNYCKKKCVPCSKFLLNFAIFSQTFHGFADRPPNKSIISACTPP